MFTTYFRNFLLSVLLMTSQAAAADQGCSMLSTEAPVGQGIEPSKGGGVSVLTEGAGSVTA